MKLKTILEHNDQNSHPQQIPNNLGDGYLVKNNCLFHAVRKIVSDAGFTFSNDSNPDYVVFGMSQLENILKSKTIPYVDNVTILRKLENKITSQIAWQHLENNLRPNHIFHESCHGLARSISENLKLRSEFNNHQEILTLITLIEESFANTCEFMAIAQAKDSVHKLFLQMNSYYTDFESVTTLSKTIEVHSAKPVFQLMLFSYLHSNFLAEKISDLHFQQILQIAFGNLAPKDQQQIKILRSLSKKAFDLNPAFRYTTTEFYLRMNGVVQPLEKALDYDFMDLIQKNVKIQNFMNQLTTSLFQAN